MGVIVNVQAKAKRQKPLSDSTSDCKVLLARNLQQVLQINPYGTINATYAISEIYEISEISTWDEG